MDWLLHGRTGQGQQHQQQHGSGQPHQPVHTPVVPQLQGDPTFLYGGYGYRPPTFGYAWMNGASQPTSYAQLPTSAAGSASAPKALSKSASAPDLQNPAAVQELQSKPKNQVPQPQHARPQGTPPLPRYQNKHLHSASVPPGTPGEQSAANTPSSSRPSTPPRRGSFDCYIGMAAA